MNSGEQPSLIRLTICLRSRLSTLSIRLRNEYDSWKVFRVSFYFLDLDQLAVGFYLGGGGGASDFLIQIIEENVVLARQVGLLDGRRHSAAASEPHFGQKISSST